MEPKLLTAQQLDLYLKRVGFEGSLEVSTDCLQKLTNAHVFTVPFENLGLHMPAAKAQFPTIEVDLQVLFEKMVLRKRGGYCHEQNVLFLAVLHTLGFEGYNTCGSVTLAPPDTSSGAPPPPPGCDNDPHAGHTVSLVTVDGVKFLVDVGMGHWGPLMPLPLEVDEDSGVSEASTIGVHVRRLRRGIYGINKVPSAEAWAAKPHETGYYMQALVGNEWADSYFFTQARFFPSDIWVYNFMESHNPKGPFVLSMMMSKPTLTGRVTIDGRTMHIRDGGMRADIELENDEELTQAIKEHYGIVFDC